MVGRQTTFSCWLKPKADGVRENSVVWRDSVKCVKGLPIPCTVLTLLSYQVVIQLGICAIGGGECLFYRTFLLKSGGKAYKIIFLSVREHVVRKLVYVTGTNLSTHTPTDNQENFVSGLVWQAKRDFPRIVSPLHCLQGWRWSFLWWLWVQSLRSLWAP